MGHPATGEANAGGCERTSIKTVSYPRNSDERKFELLCNEFSETECPNPLDEVKCRLNPCGHPARQLFTHYRSHSASLAFWAHEPNNPFTLVCPSYI